MLLCAFATTSANAQSFTLSPDSKLWVEGTSNKDDWSVRATEFKAEGDLDDGGEVRSLTITVPSSQMASEKSSIMDRLMHKTLKVDAHPAIVFELDELETLEGGAVSASGSLSIAGVTNEVTIGLERSSGDDGADRYTGSHALKMTDYGMKPPSALFGALHTSDEVTVHFEIELSPVESGS